MDKTVSIKFEDMGLDEMVKALQSLGVTGDQAMKRINEGFNQAQAGSKQFNQQTQIMNALMKEGSVASKSAANAVRYLSDAELDVAQQTIKASNAIAAQNKVMGDTGLKANTATSGVNALSAAQSKASDSAKEQATQLKKLEGGISSITSIFKGAIAVFGVKELIDTIDTYTQIQNRLKLVSSSAVDAAKNYEALKKTSMSTGTVLKDNVSLFTALTNGMKSYNVGTDRTVKVTDTIAKAMYATGASGEGAKAALVQLGQAMGSGALRGDEFNSVNENANGLMTLLAKNITRGSIPALRAMAEQGKLTTQVVFNALEKLKPEIDALAATTNMTIGQSLTNLSTAWTDYIGKADSAAGVSKTLAAGINSIASNLSSIIPIVASFAAAWAAVSFVSWIAGIGGVSGALAGLVALLGGPVAVAIGALVAGIILINDKTTLLQPLFKAVGEWASATWTLIKTGSQAVVDSLTKQFPVLQKLIDYWNKLGQQAAQTNQTMSQQPGGGRQINSIGGADALGGQFGGDTLNMGRFSAPSRYVSDSTGDLGAPQPVEQFRNGGDFTIPGAGPTDSRLVQFMATPGETISVATHRQAVNDNIPHFRNGGSIDLGLSGINVQYGAAAEQSVTGYAPQANPQPSMGDVFAAAGGDKSSADSIAQGIADSLSIISQSPLTFGRNISSLSYLKGDPQSISYLHPSAPAILSKGFDAVQTYNGFTAEAVKHPLTASPADTSSLQGEYQELQYTYNRQNLPGSAGSLSQDQIARMNQLANLPGIEKVYGYGITNNFGMSKFRDGGVGIVPGAGPVDSRLIAVSPGEQVDVKTRRQQFEDKKRSQADTVSGARNITVNIKSDDPNVFRRSKTQLARQLNTQLKRVS